MVDDIIISFREVLNTIKGQVCWSAQLSGVGSLFNLQLGEKIPRKQQLTYSDFELNPDERQYQGQYVLYVEDCPWRIDSDEVVLITWLDSNVPDGPMNTALKQLVGQRVSSIEFTHPGCDLAVRFDNNMTLRLFPDQIDADEGDNYSIALPDRIFVVAAHSTLYLDTIS